MILKEIRIYAEVLEQGLDFKSYLKDILQELHISASIKNIYSKNAEIGSFWIRTRCLIVFERSKILMY